MVATPENWNQIAEREQDQIAPMPGNSVLAGNEKPGWIYVYLTDTHFIREGFDWIEIRDLVGGVVAKDYPDSGGEQKNVGNGM